MAPILPHDMPELPHWNIYLMFVLWATQVFATCLNELYTFAAVFVIAYGGTNRHLLELYVSSYCRIIPCN